MHVAVEDLFQIATCFATTFVRMRATNRFLPGAQ